MCRSILVLVVAALLGREAVAQTVRAAIDCHAQRLDGAERETCRSPDLTGLTVQVDQLTAQLEGTLTGRDREALLDTEEPFQVQRNNCQNVGSEVHECIARVLRQRVNALTTAVTSPATIVSETTQYAFLSIPYFLKWGAGLIGKRISLWGCMTLEPGPTAASRIHGTIHECASTGEGRSVAAIFSTMTNERATWFYDAKQPEGYWQGVVERRDSAPVLAHVQP